MATAVIVTIAEAVKDALNDADFDEPFTAFRAYEPQFDLAELDRWRLCVVPMGEQWTILSRGAKDKFQYRIDIGAARQVTSTAPEHVDPRVYFVQSMADDLRKGVITANLAVCIDVQTDPVYDAAMLRNQRLFLSRLTLTYQLVR